MTQAEELQQYWKQYQQEHGYEPSGTRVVVEWAVRTGKLDLPKVDPLDVLASRMAKALRAETAVDDHGREYRLNHARRISKDGNQTTIWGILGHTPDEHLDNALGQRREQIVGDCFKLRIDTDVINDMRMGRKPFTLELDFTEDVEERLALSTHETVEV